MRPPGARGLADCQRALQGGTIRVKMGCCDVRIPSIDYLSQRENFKLRAFLASSLGPCEKAGTFYSLVVGEQCRIFCGSRASRLVEWSHLTSDHQAVQHQG